nr:hypothetical protein [Klebsiella pneumoniae]
MLTIVGGDCALLEREGGLALLSLTVAPTMVNLNLTQERYPDVVFRKTREH